MVLAEVRGSKAACSTPSMTAAAPPSRVRRSVTPTRIGGRIASSASRVNGPSTRSSMRDDNPQRQLALPIAAPGRSDLPAVPKWSSDGRPNRAQNVRIAALDQILTTRDVVAIVGHHRCTLFRWMSAGQFPHKHQFRGRKVGWLRSEIEKWLAGDKLESVSRPNGETKSVARLIPGAKRSTES
jgi:predicted DNA-binding transcriptional regulator AlpA